jgi:hypothetical protein
MMTLRPSFAWTARAHFSQHPHPGSRRTTTSLAARATPGMVRNNKAADKRVFMDRFLNSDDER